MDMTIKEGFPPLIPTLCPLPYYTPLESVYYH